MTYELIIHDDTTMLVKIIFPILFGFLYIFHNLYAGKCLVESCPNFPAAMNLGPSPPAFSPDGASILAAC